MTFLLRVETISEILQELKPVRRNGKTSLIRHRALPSVRKTPTGNVRPRDVRFPIGIEVARHLHDRE